MNKGLKLNLGCGKDKREGYLNCDFIREVNPDFICDLSKKLPFKDNSVNEILLNHVIEHVKNWDEVLIKEIYRICKNNAIIKIRAPYFKHESAFSNFQHYRFFTYTTFDLLDKNHVEHFHIPSVDFKVIYKKLKFRRELRTFEYLANIIPRIWQEIQPPFFIPNELQIILRVRK